MDKTIIIQPESGLQFNWREIAANPSGRHESNIDLVAYKALYINKIAQARARGLEPVLVSLPVMDENRFFAYITRGMSMQERKNLLFRLAALQCVHIIDITSPMLAHPNYCELLEQDGVTLSQAGESLVNTEMMKVQVHETAA